MLVDCSIDWMACDRFSLLGFESKTKLEPAGSKLLQRSVYVDMIWSS